MNPLDRALRSTLKLRHLQLLVALDRFRHIGRVADSLSVTQPAVSRSLAEIESALGLRLFDRSPRGPTPTAYGEVVVRLARSVLADFDRTSDELSALASGVKGRTAVGAMVVATPVLLARSIALLKERSPQTTVLVEEGDLAALMPHLRAGEIDLVVGRLEPAWASPDLETEALYNEPMVVVARPGHALARRRAVTWEDLSSQPWVVPPPWASMRKKLEQTFVRNRLEQPHDLVEAVSFLAIVSLVRERPAVAFMAQSVARAFAREKLVAVLPIAFRQPMPPVGIIRLRAARRTPSAEQLAECLRRVALGIREAAAPQR
ncbi:MAG: LysR family transcriptional regulator [Betaproteobacteria bacterium]|nr:LysR family transcriptional regulator [Betaproteobacteria bacterium]